MIWKRVGPTDYFSLRTANGIAAASDSAPKYIVAGPVKGLWMAGQAADEQHAADWNYEPTNTIGYSKWQVFAELTQRELKK